MRLGIFRSAIFTGLLCFTGGQFLHAQVSNTNINGSQDSEALDVNTVTTAVPFLVIAPDSRSGSMGDVGAATSADVNAIHWNPSKLATAEKDMGFGVSYTPWLKALVNDISLSYLSFYKKLDDMQAIGASLRYFSLGDIQFTNDQGQKIRDFRPNEFAVDVAFSRKLSEYFYGGIAVRFINSNLTGGQSVQGADSKPGRALAADVSGYYLNDRLKVSGKDATFAAGINISNIGNKIQYTNTSRRDFIPINLRLGPRFTYNIDDFNQISIAADMNKLMVPTPPIYYENEDGDYVIVAGSDPNKSVASGMFGSFTDAPGVPVLDDDGELIFNDDGTVQIEKGSVFKEEMREFTYSVGLEYWYDQQFAIRGGYFYEHYTKGNRKYFTLGAGLKYNVFGLDFAYLIPAYFGQSISQNSPLENTLRFTLTFDFDAFKAQNEEGTEGTE